MGKYHSFCTRGRRVYLCTVASSQREKQNHNIGDKVENGDEAQTITNATKANVANPLSQVKKTKPINEKPKEKKLETNS